MYRPFGHATTITMAPTTLSVPEIIQLVSALSYDVSPFRHFAGIPLYEKRFKGDPVVRKLLDALAFFLHTRPHRGDHFAITLSIVQAEIVATVAANTPDNITHSDPSSPRVILDTIWRHMVACSGTAEKPRENMQLATYVLETHLPLLRSRLSKWRMCYESYRDRISRFRQSGSLSAAVMDYIDGVDKIFCATVAFSESTETLSSRNISEFATQIQLCKNLSKQSTKLDATDRKLLSALQKLSGKGAGTTRYLDIIQFGEKLAAPLIHIDRVLYFCRTPKYQDSLTKPFRIRIPSNPPTPVDVPTRFDTLTKAEIAAFLRSSYMTIKWPYDDPETVTDAIEHFTGIAVDNVGKSRISGAHCECLLMQHHHSEAHGEPIMATYIGLSKPCCLQCGIFLDSYNLAVPNGPLFFVRGRNNHACPSVVPSIDAELDASIVKNMRARLIMLIAYIVDAYIKKIYARSMGYIT
ncbi:hypothetical protein QCA50_007379 [Cerrena zonata]|uniref:Uncharacterized protein n=1 Tax=Cerrena zonata TaxID=2478898 RepID=A0AAW0GAW7_9APHY